MRACTVCGEWYPSAGRDRLDICEPCYTANFAGAQPPLDVHAPRPRARPWKPTSKALTRPATATHAPAGTGPGPHARVLAAAAGGGGRGMTLQDIIDLLLAADAATGLPRDVVITRAVLLAYELGLEQGRKEAHALERD